MKEELLQFKLQKVWVLVDLPKGKRAIGSKWVFRNKKDERGIVIRNKARLVARGHTQEEGIDYDEVFAPIARIEAIRLFLAYASFMGFMVYKVFKALYGLHQAPKAWYETIANYLLENDFQRGKIDQTLFIKKQKGDILLVRVYVDAIIFRSTNKELCKDFEKLMKDKFQMSSMGELTFFVGLQIKQKDYRIFIKKPLLKDPDGEGKDIHIYRYLKGKPYLCLWYPIDSPFNLVAYSDCDYAGASLDRKSTTGGCKFLEAIIRRDIHLDNADGVECFSNEEILEELARMRYEKPPQKLTFYKACSMASAVICLATGRKFNFSKYIFDSMVRNMDSPSKFLMYLHFLQVVMDNQVDDMTTHNTRYTSHTLTHKVFANIRRVGKGFSGVETPLFASMLVQPEPLTEEEVEVPIDPSPPALQDHPSTPHATPPQDQPFTPHASPPQEQPTTTSESFMLLLITLMGTCATLSQKVAELEQDKHSQALEILQLKKRVKKLEKKKKSKSLGFKRLKRVGTAQRVESYTDTVLGAQEDASKQGGKIEAIDANESITLVDVEKDEEVVAMDAETQERLNQEDVRAAEPTVFNDEDVTMTKAQILIKLKAEKAKLLDEQIAQRLDDEEVQKATARDKQEKADMERALELQKQYDDTKENIDWSAVAKQVQERHLDNIIKCQNLKKKPVLIAQARKNMIIYLKNMDNYKMKYFRGMTYDKVGPIFEREYKKICGGKSSMIEVLLANYARATKLIRECNSSQVHRLVPRNPQQNLTPITSHWPLYKWGIDKARPFPKGLGKVKFLIVAIDYYTKWIEAKPVATITGAQIKKFMDNAFKYWCEKLCIHQCFASVKHPQANGLIKRANKSLGEEIKARLDKRSKNWLEEISHVLWQHRTMIKSSNGETPFSLTYETKAVIPVEIGMPNLRTTKQRAKLRWKNAIMPGFGTQVSSREISSIGTMKQAMQKMEASSDLSGKDHMRLVLLDKVDAAVEVLKNLL
nr:putative ribonuclease H-like domain-containing protein [Tanacetum cinerariifolium]